ncbi:hypothetical protein PR048_005602 [Dryococelus australis]|uniref:Uncharacterized protein n=1 Tax=Dryococelus australis TaxID=614101 RepID=A0ABQ9I8P7_9NEOP|nr:hypothetical protein PR048_005602 [Dryococelus australis]
MQSDSSYALRLCARPPKSQADPWKRGRSKGSPSPCWTTLHGTKTFKWFQMEDWASQVKGHQGKKGSGAFQAQSQLYQKQEAVEMCRQGVFMQAGRFANSRG